MIYRFKCKTTGDVLMAGSVGDRMLSIMSKTDAPQGILQTDDMLSDIRALELAVADEESRLSGVKGKPALDDQAEEGADAVTLRQHAWPLIEMLKQAQAAREVIVWGV